jgi:hypothetical protein
MAGGTVRAVGAYYSIAAFSDICVSELFLIDDRMVAFVHTV